MLIDWFTVGAQIVNFLVLLALLKWLLFDRVVRAMDNREQEIASRLDEASRQQKEADARAEKMEEERRQREANREEMVRQAREEVDDRRREMVQKARGEVDQLRREWQQNLSRQKDEFIRQLNTTAGDALGRAVRKALEEMADASLTDTAVRVFLERLKVLDQKKQKALEEQIKEAGASIVVASAEELAQDARQEIVQALKHQFCDEITLSFEISPELIAGVEIRANGQALEWSLRRYLDEFEETIRAALRGQDAVAGANSE